MVSKGEKPFAYPGITFVCKEGTILGGWTNGTDKDVHRQMRIYYAIINTLIRRFYAFSDNVKCADDVIHYLRPIFEHVQ